MIILKYAVNLKLKFPKIYEFSVIQRKKINKINKLARYNKQIIIINYMIKA